MKESTEKCEYVQSPSETSTLVAFWQANFSSKQAEEKRTRGLVTNCARESKVLMAFARENGNMQCDMRMETSCLLATAVTAIPTHHTIRPTHATFNLKTSVLPDFARPVELRVDKRPRFYLIIINLIRESPTSESISVRISSAPSTLNFVFSPISHRLMTWPFLCRHPQRMENTSGDESHENRATIHENRCQLFLYRFIKKRRPLGGDIEILRSDVPLRATDCLYC